MKVYLAASISGGRDNLAAVRTIQAALKNRGMEIVNDHISAEDIFDIESAYSPQHIFRRDLDWIDSADRLVAEVSVPSLGVGYEIAYALQQAKPVLCFCQRDVTLSAMIEGNDDDNIVLVRYDTVQDIPTAIETHFR
ncbi:MAG: nucleoside 2-deoxyribosyltransferase [candidate division KSB1 bacterium]|nr:nucleoside 2-deoxyribosyltransferase [candidate division KSB1 bacterium]MDQ7066100.1 nucleoside 2-deoxyribosyltransferase [candidate division KSB1 bacterium]